MRLKIAQHDRDIVLMRSLITYLGCGRVEEKSNVSMSYFIVSNFNADHQALFFRPALPSLPTPFYPSGGAVQPHQIDYS